MEELFESIKKGISQVFMGDPVMETRLIHFDAGSKFEVHLGLFRKGSKKAVWLKFIRKPWWWRKSSVGVGIRVRSFQEFAELLEQTRKTAQSGVAAERKMPWDMRVALKVLEGAHDSRLLCEYTEPEASSSTFRLYAFTDRKGKLRILFTCPEPDGGIDETFDIEVLAALEKTVREYPEQDLPGSPADGV
jgi:hypothetical protein